MQIPQHEHPPAFIALRWQGRISGSRAGFHPRLEVGKDFSDLPSCLKPIPAFRLEPPYPGWLQTAFVSRSALFQGEPNFPAGPFRLPAAFCLSTGQKSAFPVAALVKI